MDGRRRRGPSLDVRPAARILTTLDAEWYEVVERWLDDVLARAGERRVGGIQLRHEKAWSTVAVVPMSDGILYFKESASGLRFEPAYTHAIAQIRPDAVPIVEAYDARRRWLLTRDAGAAIGDGHIKRPEDWHAVLRFYGQLQLDLAPHVDEFRRLGVPDMTPSKLADALEEVLARPESHLVGEPNAVTEAEYQRLLSRAPQVRVWAEAVDDVVPLTTAHEEVHGWNVFIRNEQLRLLDWAEGGIGHPFGSLIGTMRSVAMTLGLELGGPELEGLRDAYLEAWHEFAPRDRLVELFSVVYPLGAVPRILTWDRITAPLDRDGRAAIIGGITRWLRILLAALEGDAPIGVMGDATLGA